MISRWIYQLKKMFRRSKNKLGCGMARVNDPGHLGLIATLRQGFSVNIGNLPRSAHQSPE
tara:strand:+ start:1197 stop:1376 length:180 start_codon:yes stop_codon:yes gene_type:complete